MSFPKKKVLLALILVVVFSLGFFASWLFSYTHPTKDEVVRKNFNYKFINPILECNLDLASQNNLASLKKSVQNIINSEISQNNISFASVYFRDLNNGPWFGINENEYFSPASLIKVPLLMAYFKKAEDDPSILDQKITHANSQPNGSSIQNVRPTETVQDGQEYTVENLLERMIIYSDNDAYNDLLAHFSYNDLIQVYKDLDVDISKADLDPNGNIITVQAYSSFFRILYNASYLDQDMSEKALSILSKTQYNKALAAGIPGNIKIAHKFGERKFNDNGQIQLHDCGIIYAPKTPYLLCVMTKTDDIDNASNAIKKISQKVYQTIAQNNQN
jgi:beta-lactamase class A